MDIEHNGIKLYDYVTEYHDQLPELLQIPSLHDPLIQLIHYMKYVILDFNWTEEQYELLNDVDLVKFIPSAIEVHNLPLIKYLSKHYPIPINFQPDATPDNISSYLDGNSIVTIYLEDPDLELLKGALIPCPEVLYTNNDANYSDSNYPLIYEKYLEGFNDEELEFWYGANIEYLRSMKLWSLISKNYAMQCAQEGNSYPMLTTYPEMLYPSMRPITDMSLFQTPLSNYYLNEPPIKSISVTRYAKGMSKGLFHGDRPSHICGYFYYHEPNSTTYLSYNKPLIAFNKTTAISILLEEIDDNFLNIIDPNIQDTLDDVLKSASLENHINGILPPNLMMTSYEYINYIESHLSNLKNMYFIPSDRKVYAGKLLDMYALEDPLDQPLCKIAKFLGYDVIILTHMVGSHQVVTEVLDTRPTSFSNLWFKK